MKCLYAVILVIACCGGCSNRDAEESERPAINRLVAILEPTITAAMEASRGGTNMKWETMFSEFANRDPLLKERFTKRTGGVTSLALLSTNVSAWANPNAHGREVAVILPDRLRKGGTNLHIGMRFDGELVYFTSLSPDPK